MNRPSWLRRLVRGTVLVFIAGYLACVLFLPRLLHQFLHRTMGHVVTIGSIRLGFPFSFILTNVQATGGASGTTLSSRRIVVHPRWVSWARRTLWVQTLTLEGLQASYRRTPEGRVFGPSLDAWWSAPQGRAAPWRVVMETVRVSDGIVAVVDRKTTPPFQALLAHVSVMGGPMTMPLSRQRVSLAVQAQVVGHEQHAAPVYCLGWVNLEAKHLDLSCQLEPLRLAAFRPYYQGPLQVRVYNATLAATAHLTAKHNALDGRIQVAIGNLSEADLSFMGRTMVDRKMLTTGATIELTGELQVTGPLDQPAAWTVQLAPGDEIVQQLVRPLVNRGVEGIPIKVGEQVIHVELAPTPARATPSVEEASKTVTENLQLIAPASPGSPVPTTSEGQTTEAPAPPELVVTTPPAQTSGPAGSATSPSTPPAQTPTPPGASPKSPVIPSAAPSSESADSLNASSDPPPVVSPH